MAHSLKNKKNATDVNALIAAAGGSGTVKYKAGRSSNGTWTITGLTVGKPVFVMCTDNYAYRITSGTLANASTSAYFGGTDSSSAGSRSNASFCFVPTSSTVKIVISGLGGTLRLYQ